VHALSDLFEDAVMWVGFMWSIVRSVGLVIRTRQPGLPNSPACLGLLLVFVTKIATFLYPRTHLTLLRYPYYTETVLPRNSLSAGTIWFEEVLSRLLSNTIPGELTGTVIAVGGD